MEEREGNVGGWLRGRGRLRLVGSVSFIRCEGIEEQRGELHEHNTHASFVEMIRGSGGEMGKQK